jgi:phosphotransacetylase
MPNGKTLLVVAPDNHYIDDVASRAGARGIIGAARVCQGNAESFAAAIGRLDKGNLIIAKGMIETADFLRLILGYNNKELLGPDRFISHCFIMRRRDFWRRLSRPLIITDASINIAPDADKKAQIARNAIRVARDMLGIKRPVVSFLTAAGKLNPAIKSSVDADAAMKILAGEDADFRMDQMDTAVSAAARRVKGLSGRPADILVVDDIDVGNPLFKTFTTEAGYDAAGVVCGTSVPVVLNSRADSAASKILSIKYAAGMMRW